MPAVLLGPLELCRYGDDRLPELGCVLHNFRRPARSLNTLCTDQQALHKSLCDCTGLRRRNNSSVQATNSGIYLCGLCTDWVYGRRVVEEWEYCYLDCIDVHMVQATVDTILFAAPVRRSTCLHIVRLKAGQRLISRVAEGKRELIASIGWYGILLPISSKRRTHAPKA